MHVLLTCELITVLCEELHVLRPYMCIDCHYKIKCAIIFCASRMRRPRDPSACDFMTWYVGPFMLSYQRGITPPLALILKFLCRSICDIFCAHSIAVMFKLRRIQQMPSRHDILSMTAQYHGIFPPNAIRESSAYFTWNRTTTCLQRDHSWLTMFQSEFIAVRIFSTGWPTQQH